jgi:hypothetical protein
VIQALDLWKVDRSDRLFHMLSCLILIVNVHSNFNTMLMCLIINTLTHVQMCCESLICSLFVVLYNVRQIRDQTSGIALLFFCERLRTSGVYVSVMQCIKVALGNGFCSDYTRL